MFIVPDLHVTTAAGRVIIGGQVEGAFFVNFYEEPLETGDPSAGLLFIRFPCMGEGGARAREVKGVGEGEGHSSLTPDRCVLQDPQA